MHRTSTIAAVAAAFLLSGAQSAPAPLRGEYMADCAPWDGAAFALRIPSRTAGGEFWLKAYVSLSDAEGTWRHTVQGGPGDGYISLCRKRMQMDCSYAESGSFSITSRASGRFQGTFDARFPGNKRYSFAFTAVPKPPPHQPVLCG